MSEEKRKYNGLFDARRAGDAIKRLQDTNQLLTETGDDLFESLEFASKFIKQFSKPSNDRDIVMRIIQETIDESKEILGRK